MHWEYQRKIIPLESKHSRQSFPINPNTTNQILVHEPPSRQNHLGYEKTDLFFGVFFLTTTQHPTAYFLHLPWLLSFSWCFIRFHYSQSIILKLGCWVSTSGTSQNAITGLRVSTHCGTSNIMAGYCAIKHTLNIMRPAWPWWGLLRMTILFIIYSGLVLGSVIVYRENCYILPC